MVAGALVLLALVSPAAAQDSNYWNLHYGTRGELMSGVMVGSALDLSSSFYNPGAFARMESPSVLLTGSVFAIQTVTLKQQNPDEDSPAASSAGPSPSMVAGLLPMKWFGGRMGYSFLTRQHMDFRMVARDGLVVGLDADADTLSIGGEAIFEQHMGEYWGGLTWSRALNEDVSVGTTLYGVYRSQRTRLQGLVQAFGAGGYGASGTTLREIDFYSAGALAKIGLLWQMHVLEWGVSFTTPGLQVMGSGDAMGVRSVTGDVNFDGVPDAGAMVSYGTGLDADYHSPMSVALGISFDAWDAAIHLTGEYFGSVDEYTVLDSPATDGGPGVTGVDEQYRNAAKSVFNVGIGFEREVGERGTVYAAFVTDRSARKAVEGLPVTVSTWDIYNVSGGVALNISETELTLGLGYAWGSHPVEREIPQTGDLPPNVVPTEAKYTRFKFIIGIAL
jgi:hypothetical protein